MNRVQILTVAEGEGDQRLDRWLKRRFPQLNQGRIEKMCRKGELRLNGGRAKAGARVMAGQVIRIPPLPSGTSGPDHRPPRQADPTEARLLRSRVIYRDDHLLALNKPPGLAVQGGSGQTRHVDALAPALRFERDENPRLVHRLDKDTSGVLLMARTRAVAATLATVFRRREIRKIYWAIVAGVPHPRKGRITYGLIKSPGHDAGGGEGMLCVHPSEVDRTPGARHAHTDYAVLSNLGRRAAWMALTPVTGRTHQLRAHMAGIGHPIIGDGKYGRAGRENPGDGWGMQLGDAIDHGLHLHARSLSLEHPVTKAPLTVTAPLPEHMRHTWATVGWRETDMSGDPFEGPEDV
ncbi:MAG: RluA family pseudouridine synthase [Pseudomonadota bacterium]